MNKQWTKGKRAFYWTQEQMQGYPLCLQSKQFNGAGVGGNTWVYYSKKDAKRLHKFLSDVFGDND